MLQAWRWFGPSDPVSLSDARQAGAHGIVTALHELYDGRSWSFDQVIERRTQLEAAGLPWSVCESIPMHASIKMRGGARRQFIDAWKDTIVSLGRAGVPVVCYNFMPIVDWTRTDLRRRTAAGGYALRFDMIDFIAYDVHILRRCGAHSSYSLETLREAEARLATLDDASASALEKNIIAGLPGGEGNHTRESIKTKIAEFHDLSSADMRENLLEFLREVVPVAADVGVRLAVHPDDPPFSLFGLPRIVSTADDVRAILGAVDHNANGLTLCVGSLGSRPDNDVVAFAREFGSRIHFAHLRNVTRDPDGSFEESDHLGGDADLVGVILALMEEERRRHAEGRADAEIIMRPDHGHILLDDVSKTVNPGYPCIGRLKGLAEIRGVMAAGDRLLSPKLTLDVRAA